MFENWKKKKIEEATRKLEEKLKEELPIEEKEMMAELECIKDKIRKLDYGLSEEQLEEIIKCMIIQEDFDTITEDMRKRGQRRLELIIQEEAKEDEPID